MTQDYYGTKLITAWPKRGASDTRNDGHEGYAVRYADGYESWSPKKSFEESYQPLNALSFGHALVALKAGRTVLRSGWNGKGMYLCLQVPDVDSKMSLPYIYMRTVQGDLVPWIASQTDMLDDDWSILGEIPNDS